MLKPLTMLILIGIAVGGLSASLLRPSRADSGGRPLVGKELIGTTREAGGRTLEGVAVSARAMNSNITTTVYTDEHGEYYFPVLPKGKYRVWAQAVGFAASRAEVELNPSRDTRQEFKLQTIKDFTSQLSTFEYLAALPEDTVQDRRMKQIFNHTCVGCHPGSWVLQNRFDEAGWRTIIDRMRVISYYVGMRPESSPPELTMHHYEPELAAYLAKVRGPGPSPMKFKPYPRPTGDAARVVITEYGVPPPEDGSELVDQDGSDWSEGIPASGGAMASGIHDVTVDFSGNAWITDGEPNRKRSYAKIDRETGEVTNFVIPGGQNGIVTGTHGIQVDRKGALWITINDGRLGKIDPETGKIETFKPGPGMGYVGGTFGDFRLPDFGADPHSPADGKVWITSGPSSGLKRSGATSFDPANGKWQFFESLTPGVGGYGVESDPDGNAWFCDPVMDKIGFADTKTGKITEFPLAPLPQMEALSTPEDRDWYQRDTQGEQAGGNKGPMIAQGPRRMGTYGNDIWWPNWWAGTISKIDIHTHAISYYPLPFPDSHAYVTALDKFGNVWPALFGDDRVAKFDLKTQQWTVYKLPSLGYEIRLVAVDNQKAVPEIWIPSFRASKVAHLEFRTKEQLEAVASKGVKGQR